MQEEFFSPDVTKKKHFWYTFRNCFGVKRIYILTIMKIERYFILLILVIPVLILRDFTPNNELKYLSIVDEALRNGHFFTFIIFLHYTTDFDIMQF